jgi:hypothetical protein
MKNFVMLIFDRIYILRIVTTNNEQFFTYTSLSQVICINSFLQAPKGFLPDSTLDFSYLLRVYIDLFDSLEFFVDTKASGKNTQTGLYVNCHTPLFSNVYLLLN